MGRAMKIEKVHKHRKEQEDGQFYEPHPDDPIALRIVCPVCPADVGEWCGSFGDVHIERKDKVNAKPTI
jgi:hypothetical protein